MRFAPPALALGFALSCPLGGCLSGQTGSPDCVPAVSCICDPLYGAGTLLRVHVERIEADQLEAVVDEVFTSFYGVASEAAVGDRVAGALLAEQPCAPGAPSTLQVGSELFVLYSPGHEQGSPRLLDGVFSWAVPWAETLSFGGATELSSSELSVLATPENCHERFPSAPAPPCHDTQTGLACSAGPRASEGSTGYGAMLLGLAALAVCVRRRASCLRRG
jgi:hypothetical protein